jgi:Uncharacterized protein conserved in bacteria
MHAMASPFDRFKPLAGRALEAALNRALALDLDTRDALAGLDGRRIVLTLQAPPLALQIRVAGDRLQVGPVEQAEPDLAVHGSLGALLRQLPGFARASAGSAAGGLRVAGDAELARRLQQLAAGFDPDWQAPLVAAFGEVLGVQLAEAARLVLQRARQGPDELAHTAAEFVTEESRDAVAAAELAAFCDDVDGLRDDVERLAARWHG